MIQLQHLLFFLQDYLIHCMIKNIIVLLMSIKNISSCGIMSTVLSMTAFRIPRIKSFQEQASIWLISRAMDDTSVFGSILRMIYIPSSALVSSLTRLGLSIWRGVLSSHFYAVARTVDIFPSRFFMRRFYYTFINIFWYFHAFKNVNTYFKINGFTI